MAPALAKLAVTMNLKVRDYRDPRSLKDLTDGEIYSIIAKRQRPDDRRSGSHESRPDLGRGELHPLSLPKSNSAKSTSPQPAPCPSLG